MHDAQTLADLALAAFRQPPLKLNCAQAVVHANRTAHPESPLKVEDFAELGSGRAPDNTCGALWGACAAHPEKAEELKAAFKAATGATQCRVLKRELGYPCPDCVKLAVLLSAVK